MRCRSPQTAGFSIFLESSGSHLPGRAFPAPRVVAPRIRTAEAGTGLCWGVLFMCLSMASLPVRSQPGPEPCPEGLFRDLSSEPHACRYLDFPFFGASPQLPEAEIDLDPADCSRRGVQAALNVLEAQGGGTLRLPTCLIEVDEPLLVPSFTGLVGAGSEFTILRPGQEYAGPLIRISRATDVRVAGLTLDGMDRVPRTMEIVYSRHVLAERLEVRRVTQNGLIFNQSRQVTVRYSVFDDIDAPGSYNGIGAKDCYPDRGDTDGASCELKLKSLAQNDFNKSLECATSYCVCDMAPIGEGPGYCFGYGSMFTENYLVYSNAFDGIVNDYCLALHARHGEVAGNLCQGGKHGMKSPDAWDVFVHDNLFRDHTGWGYFAYGPIKNIHPRRIHLYRNKFLRLGDVPVRTEGPEGLYLVYNTYEDNCRISTTGYCTLGENVIVNNAEVFFDNTSRAPETYICGGSSAEDILNGLNRISPFKPLYADAGTCYEILPLEIVDLSVGETTEGLQVAWRTESESGVAYFEVEENLIMDAPARRAAWARLGRVDAAGSQASGSSYRWVRGVLDLRATYRFRVRQVNLDGGVFYSPVVEWSPVMPGRLHLAPFFPSPASDRAVSTVVVGEDRHVRVDLVGMRGERLATLFDGPLTAHAPKQLSVDAGAAASGMVFVVATDGFTRVIRPLVVSH